LREIEGYNIGMERFLSFAKATQGWRGMKSNNVSQRGIMDGEQRTTDRITSDIRYNRIKYDWSRHVFLRRDITGLSGG